MRKTCTMVLGLVMMVAMTGCGGPSADSLMQDQINTLNEIKTTLESIKDDASADAALPKLDKAVARKKELDEKMATLKLSADESKKLMDAKGKDLIAATFSVPAAAMSATMKAPKKAKEISDIMAKMSSGKLPGM